MCLFDRLEALPKSASCLSMPSHSIDDHSPPLLILNDTVWSDDEVLARRDSNAKVREMTYACRKKKLDDLCVRSNLLRLVIHKTEFGSIEGTISFGAVLLRGHQTL